MLQGPFITSLGYDSRAQAIAPSLSTAWDENDVCFAYTGYLYVC